MYLVLLGLALLIMKAGEIGPVAAWSWWTVFAPFAGAIIWWSWADNSGYTRKRAAEKIEQAKRERHRKQREAMGAPSPRKRR